MWVKTLLDQEASRPLPLLNLECENSVRASMKLFNEHQCSDLIVYSCDRVMGTLNRNDLNAFAARINDGDATISDLIKTQFVWIHPKQTLQDCFLMMEQHQLKEIPVIEDGFPVAVLGIEDVLTTLIEEDSSALNLFSFSRAKATSKLKMKLTRVGH
jgi:predicted transcriptional regulator